MRELLHASAVKYHVYVDIGFGTKAATRAVAGGVSANYLKGRAKGHSHLFLNQALQTVELIRETQQQLALKSDSTQGLKPRPMCCL